MKIELAWSRLRRKYLRIFRRGYVRRMAEKRQGDCPNCPHDIIDPRDLKYCRNVCNYWFHKRDDPFTWRDELGIARAGLMDVFIWCFIFLVLSMVFAALAIAVSPYFWIPFSIPAFLYFFMFFFFRDPKRDIPKDANLLVSPADGKVTFIGEVPAPEFPGGRAVRVSIFLSIFNVHVNRVPAAGRVTNVRYFPGKFKNALRASSAETNEQMWIDFDCGGKKIQVRQIAGAIARKIVCMLKVGDTVAKGERFGMIKFGSRTDIYVPAQPAPGLLVKVGDRVKGGSTALMKL
ncbi:MAG: phosphatidylserine decarboxylase proenzyme [Gemmatales bacterium]|nr:MAG: phosphatidylserine decarboxylase proenzyme [Gemmatales bacterium]